MTTCLAYGVGEKVYMAADSMTNVYTRPVNSARKIIRQKVLVGPIETDDMLLGIAGDGGLGDMLRFTPMDCGIPGESNLDRWAYRIAQKVTAAALEHGFVEDGRMDGNVLLGFRGRVWTITHNQAIAHPDNIAAIGSGEGPAIGALDALIQTGKANNAAKAMRIALGVAIRRDQHTAGPVLVEAA